MLQPLLVFLRVIVAIGTGPGVGVDIEVGIRPLMGFESSLYRR